MLYQDKSIEELRGVLDIYMKACRDGFGSYDEQELIERIDSLIEYLKQTRFESIFRTMNPHTLRLVKELVKNPYYIPPDEQDDYLTKIDHDHDEMITHVKSKSGESKSQKRKLQNKGNKL